MNTLVDKTFQAGVAALREGRPKDAERFFAEVTDADPNHAPALYNLGVLHYQAERLTEAESVLNRAAALRPTHVGTHSVLAAVAMALKKTQHAVSHADAIIQSPDADAAALHSAGQVMSFAGRRDDAENAYRRALALAPSYRLPAVALVGVLLSRCAFVDAKQVCDAALLHRPKDQDLHLRRAQALWESGQTAQAKDALHNLLDFAPDHVTAHHNLSLFAHQADPQSVIDRLAILLADGGLPPADVIKAWFALGNLHAGLGEAEAALACFAEGNSVRHESATVLHAQSSTAFDSRVDVVAHAPLPEVRPTGTGSGPTPLIIAGPSRSGKSLLQSWLSAHPDIGAADEVGMLPKLAEQNFANDPEGKARAAEAYRATLAQLGGVARYVIDTHPTNALYLDLLLELCPDAKIIQIQRDPLDLAVCIYFRNFVTGGHWADTWPGIANRLRRYDTLRTHWQEWSPVLATLRYEDVVSRPKDALQQLFAQLGLTWDEGLAPPAGPMPSSTLKPMPWASFADRARFNTEPIDVWKPFAPWLGTFADAYGRDRLAKAPEIPKGHVAPQATLVTAVHALLNRSAINADERAILKNIPAFHASQAEQAEASGKWDDALAARWRAVSCRPFTSFTGKHVEALGATLQSSPVHRELATLHDDIARVWSDYGATSNLRFGDFGLSYQSYTPAFIAGSRDTDVRADTYDLQGLCTGQRVLDLGCNTGFLALAAATHADWVTGVEKEKALVEVGQRVAGYLKVENCALQSGDVSDFAPDETYDVVIAAAVHGWIGLPLAEFGARLATLTSANGAVLFESQGQRSTTVMEADFQSKVMALADAGFTIERQGQICDDRVNLRAFVVLRKV